MIPDEVLRKLCLPLGAENLIEVGSVDVRDLANELFACREAIRLLLGPDFIKAPVGWSCNTPGLDAGRACLPESQSSQLYEPLFVDGRAAREAASMPDDPLSAAVDETLDKVDAWIEREGYRRACLPESEDDQA